MRCLSGVRLALILCCITTADGWGKSVQDLKAQYRPSNARNLGSVGSETYRRLTSEVWWSRAMNSTVEGHLGRFLRNRIFSGSSPDQVVIADPGLRPPEGSNLDDAILARMMKDPEFITQIGSRLAKMPKWSPGAPLSSMISSGSLQKLSSDRELKEMLMTWSTDEDFIPGSIGILAGIRDVTGDEDWKNYKKLAVAISLVDDQIYPSQLPHAQVDPALIASSPNPVEKFEDLVVADKENLLLRDLSRLSVGELFFVVAHKIPLEDLAWARKNRIRTEGGNLASRSFSSIKYHDERIKEAAYSWTKTSYTPENILRQGGICVDQAYFADLMCKASGIPSMMFTGTGDEGGHAWVGFLTENGEWDVTVGRQGGLYLTGKTYNPQNWLPETDHDFGFFTASSSVPARFEANLSTMFWEEGLFDHAILAINSASALAPSVPSIWEKKFKYASKTARPSQISSDLKSTLRNKELSPSVRASVKKELASTERELGRHASALRVEKNIVEENLATRADISTQAVADRVRYLLEAGETDKALSEFKVAIRNLPDGSRGDFFYNVARPLGGYLSDMGRRPQAMQVARLARQKLNPPKDSLLDQDLRELEKKASRTKR